ncbi:MAG: hypothetical protein AAGD96_27570 [Chloroflexota bacterium]
MNNIEGAIVTGFYGVGKSSVVEEIANQLDQLDATYAAIDVDWLWWFNNPTFNDDQAKEVLLANLASITENYKDAGVSKFIFAWSIRDKRDLEKINRVLSFPLKVIGLTAPMTVIEARLNSDVTSGRQNDLKNSQIWSEEGFDNSLLDLEISNNQPIQRVAQEILEALNWHQI